MKISKQRTSQIVNWLSTQTTSLDAPIGEDGATQVSDLIEDEAAKSPQAGISKLMIRENIENLLDLMSQREREILDMRFGLIDGKTQTLAEVSQKIGVSRERVRQVEEKALKKLRRYVKSHEREVR